MGIKVSFLKKNKFFIILFLFIILNGCASKITEQNLIIEENNLVKEDRQVTPGFKNLGELKNLPGPGYAEIVAASDGIAAWLSRDKIIQVVDIGNPQSPKIIKTLNTPGFTESIVCDDHYCYVTDNKEFQIRKSYDTEPSATYQLDGFWPEAFTVHENYAYIVSGNEMMILDVSDTGKIKKISQLTLTGMAPSDIIVHEGYAYIVQTLGGLNIIDIRKPEEPKSVYVMPFESHTVGFKIEGNNAYLGRITSLKQGKEYKFQSLFEIIDIANPEVPIVVGSVIVPTNIKGLDIDGNNANLIGGTYPYRFVTVDISSLKNPVLRSSRDEFPGEADFQDILVDNGRVYIADGMGGLQFFEISEPQQAKKLNLQGRAFRLKKAGNLLYISVEQKYFNVADVHNYDNPQLTYTETFTASYPYTSVVLQNRSAYVKTNEFKIYNLSDPSHPIKVNKKAIEVDSIRVQNYYLYSTVGEIGLLVFDISNPLNPVLVSVTPFIKGIPRDLSVDGKWAVGVSNIPYSISAFDISEPRKPVAKESYLYEQYPDRVAVKNGRIYVARGRDGLDLIKITDDGSLNFIKNIKKEGYTRHVAVNEDKLIVVREGIDIYDIRDPAHEIFIEHWNTAGEANHAAIDENYLYIADGYAGLSILPIKFS